MSKEDFALLQPNHLRGPTTEPPPPIVSVPESQGIDYGSLFGSPDVYVPAGGEEPPPDFAPYEAKYFVSGSNGDIVSHDSHLNEDGEALYRFLLSRSQIPPTFCVNIQGSHMESQIRLVTQIDENGNITTVEEVYTEEVQDFDFSIDIGQCIALGPVHWSIPDEEPAFRGEMIKEVDILLPSSDSAALEHGGLLSRRKASSAEIKCSNTEQKEKAARGLPPWAALNDEQSTTNVSLHQTNVLKSSRTLRQWADEYCASNKPLKEFTYEKVVYGWHLANLQAAITAAVRSTHYTGSLSVGFRTTNSKIHIRPDNRLSRTLSNTWLKFLLAILLIYPFIWLFSRLGKRGGRWKVCGGAYALKSWQLADSSHLTMDPAPPYDAPKPSSSAIDHSKQDGRTMPTPSGTVKLIGVREGEWFQQWEGTIRRAVTGRLRTSVPLLEPNDRPTASALSLDGYRPVYM